MVKISKKIISLILTISIVVGLFTGFGTAVSAADNVTVKIVSFLRGEQEDLRSSELLEARVEGYSGNVQELTYKWTNGIGTYLYVYNSHNMYGINMGDGEVEIYNSSKTASANMPDRSYEDSFSGTGYAWAAIYGADTSSSVLTGTITVEVYDPQGNLLATDSHTGTREGFWFWQTYHGFVPYDLQDDLKDIHFGLFEGDTRNIQDLLGENGLLHVSCEACTISNGRVTSGSSYISVAPSSVGTYEITGLSRGTGVTNFTITKDNCKFHNDTSGTATATAYVYRKPTTTATTTTITLEHLDDNCTYYINGEKGVRNGDSITFAGLTPNTSYEVEVVGQAEGTTPVYAYVYQSTLPLHTATVEVRLDGTYDSTTATATGTLVDIKDMLGSDAVLYLRKDGTEEYFLLESKSTGIYTATVENGTYYVYTAPDASSQFCDQQMDIANADRTRYLFFFSVSYDANGGSGAPAVEYYHDSKPAKVSDIVPTKEGYAFSHWEDQYGNTYKPGDTLTDAIYEKYTLTAQYVKTTDVYVNITINHISPDGHNNDENKHNITFTLDQRAVGTTEYDEIDEKTIKWNGTGTVAGFDAIYDESEGVDVTTYTATTPTFTDVPADMEYTTTTAKSHYSLQSVTQTVDANGNIIINANLIYDPHTFDFTFDIELDDAAKALPAELKPIGLGVKVSAYHNHPHDGVSRTDWHTIANHSETYVRVPLDANGKGTGTFPVPSEVLDENGNPSPYYYRIEVVTYGLPDGSVMSASDFNNAHTTYVTDDHRYWAEIVVTDGKDPASTGLTGVWYGNGVQNGSIKAVVSVEVFDVTFNPNGGILNGTTSNTVVASQIAIPELAGYVPTREGGYVFDGWYVADGNGNMTDVRALSNEVLYSDVILVAKWREPITIKGTVAVAGVYELEDGKHEIPDHDRIKSVTVIFQHIDPNGYAVTKSSQDITITYNGDIGTGTYEFAGVPNDGDAHRINVISANYVSVFQNEPASVTNSTDYASYDTTSYTAQLDGDNTAVINAYLHFKPTTFDLQYQINAKAIANGYIPQVAETLVVSGSNGSTETWPPISQMVQNGQYKGQKTEIIDGIGNNSYPVWNNKPDGVTLYQYGIKIHGYTLNGKELPYNPSAPFMVVYNGSARYDAQQGQTQLLVATLVPKLYHVTLDVNAPEDEEVGGMEDYITTNNTYGLSYYWSYGAQIEAQPERAGYKFLGWEDDAGNAVTAISPETAQDLTLYAQWEPVKYTITTVTLEGGTTTGDGEYEYGTEVTITATPGDGYSFIGWYDGGELVSTDAQYKVTVTDDKTYTAKFEFGLEAIWHYDTDSGYFVSGGKSSVVRFLFDVEFSGDVSDKIVNSGIKFIKAENIIEDIANATMIDAGLVGNVSTFYGDIVNITEDNAGKTYIAVAYITIGGKTFWSKPLECQPDFSKLIIYD